MNDKDPVYTRHMRTGPYGIGFIFIWFLVLVSLTSLNTYIRLKLWTTLICKSANIRKARRTKIRQVSTNEHWRIIKRNKWTIFSF